MATNNQFVWNDIPVLLAVAREKSMRKAAEALRVDVSTVSRRVAAAEARLGTRLFIRRPTGYEATDAGRAFLDKAATIDGDIRALIDITAAESEGITGDIRITSVDVLIDNWLIPRLSLLLQKYPDLRVRVQPDNHALSFTRLETDLALRIARPKEDAAILMRRVGHIGMAVYGTPAFADMPRRRWPELPWLSFEEDLANAQEMQWLAKHVPSAGTRFRSSAASSLLQACRSGLGVALLPCFAAEAAGLYRLSRGIEFKREIWLLRHRHAGTIQRYRAVAEWLADSIREDGKLLAGTA